MLTNAISYTSLVWQRRPIELSLDRQILLEESRAQSFSSSRRTNLVFLHQNPSNSLFRTTSKSVDAQSHLDDAQLDQEYLAIWPNGV